MKTKKQNGFTLVELLVAISIMALIMAIAIPSIRNLQSSNKETKYEKYGESLVSGGKLYIDSYGKDEFGNNATGCIDIPYSLLKKKNLIKDIKVDDTICSVKDADNKELTFVRVRKANDQYSYELSIKCTKNGAVVYDKTLTPGACTSDGPDKDGPTIKISPNGTENYVKEIPAPNNKVTVSIYDEYGLNKNIKFKYAWTQNSAGNVAESSYSQVIDFKNNAGLKIGNADNESSWLTYSEIAAPTTASGDPVSGTYYLVIQPVDVRDFVGNIRSQKVISAPFKFDNTKPIITTKTNTLPDGNWTNNTVTITAEATDKPDGTDQSGIEKIVYSYTSSATGSNLLEDWNTNDITRVEKTWSNPINKNLFVFAIDKAGNISDAYNAGYVRIDKTPPTITISKTGVMGEEGWYVSNVEIKSTMNDEGGAGVAEYGLTTSSTPVYNGKSEDVQSTVFDPGIKWYAYVKDAAGNTASAQTEQFIVIANPPVITFSLDGKTSTAKCKDGNTGEAINDINNKTADISSSLSHKVTCSDQYGLTTTATQKYKKSTKAGPEVCGQYSCGCPCNNGSCYHHWTCTNSSSCCGDCGCSPSTITVYSKNGDPIIEE